MEILPEATGALGAATPILESISNPPGGAGWSWVWCGCHRSPFQTKFQFCRFLRIGSIKLQLLFGVWIELAVGSLTYLAVAQYLSGSLPHATFCMKKGCYKHASPLDLRLNPTRGLSTTGSRIWGQLKQKNNNDKPY